MFSPRKFYRLHLTTTRHNIINMKNLKKDTKCLREIKIEIQKNETQTIFKEFNIGNRYWPQWKYANITLSFAWGFQVRKYQHPLHDYTICWGKRDSWL